MYMDELERRAPGPEGLRFDRAEDLARAVHEAYRITADHLTREEGWEDDIVLTLVRGFNHAAKRWIDGGSGDLRLLGEELRSRWREWERAHGGDGED